MREGALASHLAQPTLTLQASPLKRGGGDGWDGYSQKPTEPPPQLPNLRIKGLDGSSAFPPY